MLAVAAAAEDFEYPPDLGFLVSDFSSPSALAPLESSKELLPLTIEVVLPLGFPRSFDRVGFAGVGMEVDVKSSFFALCLALKFVSVSESIACSESNADSYEE